MNDAPRTDAKPSSMQRFFLRICAPVLLAADHRGFWTSLRKGEDEPVLSWFSRLTRAGFAIGWGWLEQDDLWVRITPAGVEALAATEGERADG